MDPLRKESQSAPAPQRPDSAPPVSESAAPSSNTTHDEALVSPKATGLSLGPNPLSSIASAPVDSTTTSKEGEIEGDIKEEDDDLDDDDDMLDAEVEEGATAQTAEQRRAERRKMKRFR
jgi:hypothetical protein